MSNEDCCSVEGKQKDDGSIDSPCFHIVALGASAGGLEPIEQFFQNMPSDTGMAFVLIQHLSPDFKSQMEQLLSRKTRMAIHRVENGVEVQPNNIYLIPPKKMMAISGNRLLLTDKETGSNVTLPIDEFFRSLAVDIGRHAVGIVLSGTGSDGAKGVEHIAAAGGLVMVQSEDTAGFDGMPLAAIATGLVNVVAAPAAMPAMLCKYVSEGLTPEALVEQDLGPEDVDMQDLFEALKSAYKIDFSLYKGSTIGRRVKRRMLLKQYADLEDYIAFACDDPEELDVLYQDLLIGVTRFFRDKEAFDYLETQVIPRIVSQKKADETIRVWVAASATGEEPYSFAILLHEHLSTLKRPFNVKIFATDVHQRSIKAAGQGVYSEEALANVSQARKDLYFTRSREGDYSVNSELRNVISFAQHNVITDAPFTRMDLISCRNLLIYLQPNVQKKIISLFHFSLNVGGTLMLGSSETIGDLASEFSELHGRHRLYSKKRNVRLPVASQFSSGMIERQFASTGSSAGTRPEIAISREKGLGGIYERLMEQYIPPSVLLDEHFTIVHVFGGAEKFLRIRAGRPSNQFLNLVAPEAKTAFAAALNHAAQKEEPVHYTGIRLPDNDGNSFSHHVSIQPIYDARTRSNYFFLKMLEQKSGGIEAEDHSVNLDSLTREHIDTLESELRFTQENLQATIEELETANEEMQASNEELVASNEELQSTNEELQSVNEELYTVNYEHQRKIAELVQANEDMDNLLATTRVGVIFLDTDLCIRRYTPEFARLFHLLPQDIGRSIEGFSHTLQTPDLVVKLEQVLSTGAELEEETRDKNGTAFILRILPYRTADTREPAGVLLTLIDIDNLRRAQGQLSRFKAISDLNSDGNALVTADGDILYANRSFSHKVAQSANQVLNRKLFDFLDTSTRKRVSEMLADERLALSSKPFESVLTGLDQSPVPVEVNVVPVKIDGEDEDTVYFFGFRDISERLKARSQLTLRTQALESSQNGFVISRASGDQEIVYANQAFYDITGYSEDEVIGSNCRFLQGEDTDPEAVREISEAVRTGKGCQVTLKNYRKDGQAFWNSLMISPVKTDLGGDSGYFIGIINDTTDLFNVQQQARDDARKIRLLLNSTEEGIFFVDVSGKCSFCNQSAARLLGFSSTADLMGKDVHDLLHYAHPDGQTIHREDCLILASTRSGETVGSEDEVFWTAAGKPLPVEYWSHPIVEENGEISGTVVTFIDITLRKQNARQLEQLRQTAESANHAKSVFLANISHELRTPLTAILGYLDLMEIQKGRRQSSAGDGSTAYLDILKRNSLHLLDLLNDLLDLSKIETGNLKVSMEECDVGAVLRDALSIASLKTEAKNLSLDFYCKGRIPQRIVSDAMRLRQIILNLLGNAVKFTEDGGLTFTVELEKTSPPYLKITIADTGVGISSEQQPQVFEPFVRGGSASARDNSGSGLGLSISKHLAEQLGGSLGFNSSLGQGSEFWLRLPAKIPEATPWLDREYFDQRQSSQETGIVLPKLSGKALVVDDNRDIRDLLSRILADSGLRVSEFSDGRPAVSHVRDVLGTDEEPLIILMDVNLEQVNGDEATRQLRNLGYQGPIIAITAGAMKGERERCLLLGFTDYISKPVDISQLTGILEGHLSAPAGGQPQAAKPRTSRKVLIVEDNFDVAISTKQLLQSQGHEAEPVFSGREALASFRRSQPDVVLMDLNLPDMSGLDVMKQLREIDGSEDTHFVAVTGYSDSDTYQLALETGFDDYLIKPVTFTEIVKIVENCC